jgi:hypothetical protein
MKNSLPTATFMLTHLRNPGWIPEYVDGFAINDDSYYISAKVEVEILTVHIEKRTMRIRFMWNGKKETRDVCLGKNTKVSIEF